jgi:hypothetical protein
VIVNITLLRPGETCWARRDVVEAVLAKRPKALIVVKDPGREQGTGLDRETRESDAKDAEAVVPEDIPQEGLPVMSATEAAEPAAVVKPAKGKRK